MSLIFSFLNIVGFFASSCFVALYYDGRETSFHFISLKDHPRKSLHYGNEERNVRKLLNESLFFFFRLTIAEGRLPNRKLWRLPANTLRSAPWPRCNRRERPRDRIPPPLQQPPPPPRPLQRLDLLRLIPELPHSPKQVIIVFPINSKQASKRLKSYFSLTGVFSAPAYFSPLSFINLLNFWPESPIETERR